MQKPCLSLLSVFIIFSSFAQPGDEDLDKLFPALLPEYKYNAGTSTFTGNDGRNYKFAQTEFTELEGKTLLVAWLQSEESYDRFNQLHLFEYEKQKKKFVVTDHSIILDRWITQLSVNTINIAEQKQALEITSGYDSDGDGDEITYSLFAYLGGSLNNILEHALRTDSGDGCEGEDMESTITISDEVMEGFKNFNVEETTSTFNDCDENSQESCTRTSRYIYIWSGTKYERSN